MITALSVPSRRQSLALAGINTHADANRELYSNSPNSVSELQQMDEDEDDAIKIESILPSLLAQIDPSEDAACLSELNCTLKKTDTVRGKQVADSIDVLKNLSRELEAAKRATEIAQSERAANHQEHNAKIAILENEKFGIVKQIHEAEKLVSGLDAKKRQLTVELEELKVAEAEEFALKPDPAVLKLSIYKSLGIDLVYEQNKIVRCLVRSINKNDIVPLEIDDQKYSNYFYANCLWEMCSN